MNARLKKKKAKLIKNGQSSVYLMIDCANCVSSRGLFYENTGTCEENLFLGECNFKPLKATHFPIMPTHSDNTESDA